MEGGQTCVGGMASTVGLVVKAVNRQQGPHVVLVADAASKAMVVEIKSTVAVPRECVYHLGVLSRGWWLRDQPRISKHQLRYTSGALRICMRTYMQRIRISRVMVRGTVESSLQA